jgi:hypothetical protein
MDIEVNTIVENENKSKQWEYTLMFEVCGLEGQHEILQYVKPNPLASALETIVKCHANHYPSRCMMRFPEVYSTEDNWELGLKVALTKAAEKGGYSLCQTKKLQTHSPTKSQCDREEGGWLDIHAWLRPQRDLSKP